MLPGWTGWRVAGTAVIGAQIMLASRQAVPVQKFLVGLVKYLGS